MRDSDQMKGRAHSDAFVARELERARHKEKPLPPAYLTPGAMQVWNEVVDAVDANHFEPGDYRTLAAYCEACALLERMSSDVDDEPYTIEDDKGNVKVNPFHTLFKNTASQIQTFALRLKLAPSTRTKDSAASKRAGRASRSAAGSSRRQAGLMFQGNNQGADDVEDDGNE